jgi:hypothetical protein
MKMERDVCWQVVAGAAEGDPGSIIFDAEAMGVKLSSVRFG